MDLKPIRTEAEHRAALAEIERLRPDVIFLDIQMPGLTGVEAAREIAQIDVGEDGFVPEIVFVTAYDQ